MTCKKRKIIGRKYYETMCTTFEKMDKAIAKQSVNTPRKGYLAINFDFVDGEGNSLLEKTLMNTMIMPLPTTDIEKVDAIMLHLSLFDFITSYAVDPVVSRPYPPLPISLYVTELQNSDFYKSALQDVARSEKRTQSEHLHTDQQKDAP